MCLSEVVTLLFRVGCTLEKVNDVELTFIVAKLESMFGEGNDAFEKSHDRGGVLWNDG